MKLTKIFKTILVLLSLCLMSSAVKTYAQDSKDSQSTIQNSAPTVAATPVVVPDKYNSDQFVQTLLAIIEKKDSELKNAKDRNSDLVGNIKEIKDARDEWKNLYLEQIKATKELRTSAEESRGEAFQLRIANDRLLVQQKSDDDVIKSLDKKVFKLKVEKYVVGGIGAAAGYGICRATTP